MNSKERYSDSIYEPLNFFMVRAPLAPNLLFHRLHEDYEDKIDKELNTILNDFPMLNEALLLSSPSLYKSIKSFKKNNINKQKKLKQVRSSLYRYINRMSTRPTPFGLFSGIGMGEFATTSNVQLGLPNSHSTRSRPDMEWLLKLIFIIENDVDINRELDLQVNQLAFKIGDRIKVPYTVRMGNNKEVSVKYSRPLKDVMNIAKEPIKYDLIFSELEKRYPRVSKTVLYNFMEELIEKEILLTELRPYLEDTNPLKSIIYKLKGIKKGNKYTKNLIDILNLLKEYDNTSIGNGEALLNDIHRKMNLILKSNNYLQVDTLLKLNNNTLSKEVGKEFALAADLLWQLSFVGNNAFKYLESYHNKFIEKYGINREIPLLELFSEEVSIGIPENYKYTEPNSPNLQHNHIQQKFLNEIIHAVKSNETTINLSTELVKMAKANKEIKNAPNSMELYGEIKAHSFEELDKGNFEILLNPSNGSDEAGKTFGRFIDILNTDVLEELKISHKNLQEEYLKEGVLVDTNYLSSFLRVNNLIIGENYSDYDLNLGVTNNNSIKNINLKDVYVGANPERFYFKSKKLNKELIFTSGNMLNYNLAPPIYRFMRDVSKSRFDNWNGLTQNLAIDLPYIPRIKYNKTILQPARWKFNINLSYKDLSQHSDSDWIKYFSKWINEWKVPRFVYMAFSDNKLLLDLKSKTSIYEVRNQLKKTPNIIFIENIMLNENEKNQLVTNIENEPFNMECVVPIKKKANLAAPTPIQFNKIDKSYQDKDENYIKIPGSEYFYVKIYIPKSLQDEFISKHLIPFANKMKTENKINSFYFIRYKNEEHHLRVRFIGVPTTLRTKFMNDFYNFAEENRRNKKIKKITIDTYEREINRYGGPHLINQAEDFFYHDTKLVYEILKLNNCSLSIEALAAISIIGILYNSKLSFKEQEEFLLKIVDKREFLEDFRNYRERLITVADPYRNWEGLIKDPELNVIYKTILETTNNVNVYFNKVSESEKHLWNTKDSILSSIIHMHCNRLIGIERIQERKAIAFAYQILHAQKYWRNIYYNS